jgi:hypothetical protein
MRLMEGPVRRSIKAEAYVAEIVEITEVAREIAVEELEEALSAESEAVPAEEIIQGAPAAEVVDVC